MEKKMVNGLPIPLTYISPIDHNDLLLPKIVHDIDQTKKAAIKGTLVRQILFQGKKKKKCHHNNQDLIEESNIEQPSFGGGPLELVFTYPPHFNLIQQIE